MRDQLIKALLAHAQGDIQKHVANVEVYLTNPAGIGEHSNIVEAIETELDMIAKYQDQIDIIHKYFKKPRCINLVTSEEILPLIEPALKDVTVDIEQNDSKNLVVRFSTPDRVHLDQRLKRYYQTIILLFGDITNKTLAGTFGGTQIDTYDLKRIRLRYKAPQGGGARGGARIANLGEGSQCIYAAIAFGLGRK